MNKKLIIIAVIVVLLISVIGIAVFSFEDEPELEFEPELELEPEPEPEPEQAVSELETPASTFAPAPQAEVAAAPAAAPAAAAPASRKCKSNAQCNKGWWCQNGTCVEGCHSNTDPRNPATGKCLWNNGNIPIGQQCNRNIHSDCESNYCLNSHCVAAKKYTPIGCYKDKANPRALPHFLGNAGTKTDFVRAANYCAKKATDAGYKYFGLQYPPGGTQCWAGNNLIHAKKYGQETCGLGGGANKNYLYTLTNLAAAPSTPPKKYILPKITSNEQCTRAGGNSYNYCQSSGIHYCCGACNGQATCGSNSGLRGCACSKDVHLISTSSNKLNLVQVKEFNKTVRNLPVPFYMQFTGTQITHKRVGWGAIPIIKKFTIIYKRLTPVGDWNFFRLLHYDWFGCEEPGKCRHGSGEDNKPPLIENKAISNTMNTDFKLFSNLNDAKTDTNAWKFCNFNDATVGFPRDCGPTVGIGNRWMRYYPGKTGTNTPFRWELVI